jgi:hypothetical protein
MLYRRGLAGVIPGIIWFVPVSVAIIERETAPLKRLE